MMEEAVFAHVRGYMCTGCHRVDAAMLTRVMSTWGRDLFEEGAVYVHTDRCMCEDST